MELLLLRVAIRVDMKYEAVSTGVFYADAASCPILVAPRTSFVAAVADFPTTEA